MLRLLGQKICWNIVIIIFCNRIHDDPAGFSYCIEGKGVDVRAQDGRWNMVIFL